MMINYHLLWGVVGINVGTKTAAQWLIWTASSEGMGCFTG